MKQLNFGFPIPDGYKLIFRACITLKSGKIICAKQFGKKAFPLIVREDKA